jgi:hypothetical protein
MEEGGGIGGAGVGGGMEIGWGMVGGEGWMGWGGISAGGVLVRLGEVRIGRGRGLRVCVAIVVLWWGWVWGRYAEVVVTSMSRMVLLTSV